MGGGDGRNTYDTAPANVRMETRIRLQAHAARPGTCGCWPNVNAKNKYLPEPR